IGGNNSGQQRDVKCFNCQGKGHMARQCPKPKSKRDATWFRDKVLLVEAQRSRKVLNKEELELLAEPGVAEGPVVLMANLSSYGSNVLSEVPHFENAHNDMLNKSVQEMPYSEQTCLVNYPENEEKNAQFADFEKEFNSLKQTLSEQSKEKELLIRTFNIFKNESKKKEAKNIDKEIALEKKVKELDNMVCKMGKSAQTVHILMKPQVYYDNNLKQALGFQNPFCLKKAQQIRPMLYDGNVIAKETNVISIADSEETLMLEEESRSKMLLKQNFGKRFVPQQELSNEQALWLQTSHPNTNQAASSFVKIRLLENFLSEHVKHPVKGAKALCSVCNEYLFDANHAMCLTDHVNSMNVHAKSAFKTNKKRKEWKPTRKVFNCVGYKWKPTGRTFTLVGNACPLTRLTATNKVPLRVPISLKVIEPIHVVTRVYTRRPKVPKSVQNSKPKVAKSMIANRMKPGTSQRSDTSVAPSSSSLINCRLSKLFCGIWTLDAPRT
nr:hypothetical protein [Tanacetum cinerariifolium]